MLFNDTTIQRFWAKVDKNGPNGCWLWTGYTGSNGYGRFHFQSRRQSAHRFAYELVKGTIPEPLQIDHLCRNPPCVNPDHLEAVTGKVNILRGVAPSALNARKTHCIHGHPFDKANTYIYPSGRHRRVCRICRAEMALRRYHSKQFPQ